MDHVTMQKDTDKKKLLLTSAPDLTQILWIKLLMKNRKPHIFVQILYNPSSHLLSSSTKWSAYLSKGWIFILIRLLKKNH